MGQNHLYSKRARGKMSPIPYKRLPTPSQGDISVLLFLRQHYCRHPAGNSLEWVRRSGCSFWLLFPAVTWRKALCLIFPGRFLLKKARLISKLNLKIPAQFILNQKGKSLLLTCSVKKSAQSLSAGRWCSQPALKISPPVSILTVCYSVDIRPH